jgi:hypothetical protein
MRAAFVVLLVVLFTVPAWAKGNGGGHGASGGHGKAGVHASHAGAGKGATSQNFSEERPSARRGALLWLGARTRLTLSQIARRDSGTALSARFTGFTWAVPFLRWREAS